MSLGSATAKITIKSPIKGISLIRLIFLFPLALSLWWFMLEPLILPTAKLLSNFILKYIFFNENIQIVNAVQMNWLIETNLSLENQPKLSSLSMESNFSSTTLGLPLLWVCCFIFYHRPQGLNVLVGSLVLMLLISFVNCIQIEFLVFEVIKETVELNKISSLAEQAGGVINLMAFLSEVLVYFVILIFPILYCYWVNSELILEMLYIKRKN